VLNERSISLWLVRPMNSACLSHGVQDEENSPDPTHFERQVILSKWELVTAKATRPVNDETE
jgi:hypothetical protein